MPVTGTGEEEPLVFPCPICPSTPAPQQYTPPLAVNAHAKLSPVTTLLAVGNPVTETGVKLEVAEPLPS